MSSADSRPKGRKKAKLENAQLEVGKRLEQHVASISQSIRERVDSIKQYTKVVLLSMPGESERCRKALQDMQDRLLDEFERNK